MNPDRAPGLKRGCLALILLVSESQARSECETGRAVALDIVEDAASTGADGLEQSVIAELGAGQIAVCAASEQLVSLARVQIRATLPDWQRATIRLESASAPALERDLDVSKLPPEARALAIASATDELVRSAFAAATASASASSATLPGEPESRAPSGKADRSERDRPLAEVAASDMPETLPLVEAGLAAGASMHLGQRDALEGDLAGRYWLLPRLPLSARVGFAQRLSRPLERGAVQPGADVHAALGAGLVLLSEPRGFHLMAGADLQLSRVGFDERVTLVDIEPPGPTTDEPSSRPLAHTETHALDHAWALAAGLGLEGRLGLGPMGASLAVAGLVPIVPPRSDWGDETSLDRWGVQLRAGVWVRLGSRSTGAAATEGERR